MSTFDAITLIFKAGLQPLSIAKTNIFHQQPRFYRHIYYSAIVHASKASEEVPLVVKLLDGARFHRSTKTFTGT